MADLMTRPWSKIAEHYTDFSFPGLSAINAIQVLVERIMISSLVDGLHAWTSAWDLCLVQNEASYPYEGAYLRISPVGDDIEFHYIETGFPKKVVGYSANEFVCVVPASDAWPQLLSILEQLHWFTALDIQSVERNGGRQC